MEVQEILRRFRLVIRVNWVIHRENLARMFHQELN
jgi:hypothetical protein